MSDHLTPLQRHECMSHIRSKDTALEPARKRREIAALVEAELNLQFHIPYKVQKESYSDDTD